MFENHDFKPYYIYNGGKCIQGADRFLFQKWWQNYKWVPNKKASFDFLCVHIECHLCSCVCGSVCMRAFIKMGKKLSARTPLVLEH